MRQRAPMTLECRVALAASRGVWRRPGTARRGGGGGGGAGVRAAEAVQRREGQHLRNPPPAAAAAASLRPGELSARPARLPERRQPPAALAPRRRAAAASGGAAPGLGLGVGRRSPAEARAAPWSSALAPLQRQVSGGGDAGRREARGRGPGGAHASAGPALPGGGRWTPPSGGEDWEGGARLER